MKMTRKSGYNGSLRKVWNDEKTKCYGVVGTVGDFLAAGILRATDAPSNVWAFIYNPNTDGRAVFADTKEAVLRVAKLE